MVVVVLSFMRISVVRGQFSRWACLAGLCKSCNHLNCCKFMQLVCLLFIFLCHILFALRYAFKRFNVYNVLLGCVGLFLWFAC